MQEGSWLLSCLMAAGVTCLCAGLGFNRPSWSRSYTTAARFRYAGAGHIAAYLVLLLMLYAIVRRGFSLALSQPEPGTALLTLWLALLLTLAVRAVPAISHRVRTMFHRLAGIPDTGRRLADLLSRAEFEAPTAVGEESKALLLSLGVDAERDWLPLTQPMHRQLLKATALFLQIRQWEQNDRFAPFTREARHDIDLLRRRFDRLSFRVARTLASIERLGEVRHLFLGAQPAEGTPGPAAEAALAQLDPLLRKLIGDMIADGCEDIAAFHADACLLAARAVMVTQATRQGRDRLVSQLGFMIQRRETPAAYGVLALALVGLYFGVKLFLLILPGNSTPAIGMSGLGTVITVSVFGSLLIGVVPKLHWGFANAGLHERTPVPFVVGAGVAAMLFAVVVNLTAGALIVGGWAGALQRLGEGSRHLHASFVTAATMAWLVQDHRWREVEDARTRRWLDAAMVAGMWIVSALIARLLGALLHDQVLQTAPLVKAVIGSVVLGGALGYAIPESVRVDYLRKPVPKGPLLPSDFVALSAGRPG